jgi:hypothetical protein
MSIACTAQTAAMDRVPSAISTEVERLAAITQSAAAMPTVSTAFGLAAAL